MNEDARVVGEAIEHIEGQDASSKEVSQNDSLALSNSGVQIEEYHIEIIKFKAEAAELKAVAVKEKAKRQRMEAEAAEEKAKSQTMKNLLKYIIQQQGGNLPPEIAADLDSLGSAPTSSQAR
ncbi:hypothetical protein AHAS_Ahas17G0102000 [Arachis hypogaea]